MLKNRLLLDVLEHKPVDRTPIWLMRQAGRILPQYRAIRQSIPSFKHLVKNPDLASEVTIQPVDELGVDAAIIFSDILVIPEAMGLDYRLVESVGPIFDKTIETKDDVERMLAGEQASDRLDYVYDAIKRTKSDLKNRVPLIGFCGAPWTIFTYMIEGKGSKAFTKARKFLFSNPELSHKLLEKITLASISYLKNQINAGANVVQVFDSWAGVLNRSQYQEFVIPYLKQIRESIDEVPVILFSKGVWHSMRDIQKDCTPQCLGVDWTMEARWIRQEVGSDQVLQGNFDPAILYSDHSTIELKTKKMLEEFGQCHIANLGHGVYPDTPLEHVRTFVSTVKNHRFA